MAIPSDRSVFGSSKHPVLVWSERVLQSCGENFCQGSNSNGRVAALQEKTFKDVTKKEKKSYIKKVL